MSINKATWALMAGLIFGFSIIGCTKHLTNEAVPGEYHANGKWGNSTLLIRNDGTFRQDVLLEGKVSKHIDGKWMMLDDGAYQYTRSINFKPFLSMLGGQIGQEVGNASCTVESIGLHSVWIDVDADAGTTYKKQ